MTKPERIALIDMDGTVADWEGAMKRDYDRMIGPDEMDYYQTSRMYSRDDWPEYLDERVETVQRQVGWWRNLARLDVGFEIVNVLKKFDFSFHVATKGPSSKPQAWAEKMEWVREHMPYADIHVTERKSLLYGKVLVDDWPQFGIDWLANRPRGLVIMPRYHYNEKFNHPQVFKYSEGDAKKLTEHLERFLAQ